MKASSNKYIYTTEVALFDVDIGFESRYSSTRVLTDTTRTSLRSIISYQEGVLCPTKNYVKIHGHVKNHGVEKGFNVSEIQLQLRLRFQVCLLPLLDCFAFVSSLHSSSSRVLCAFAFSRIIVGFIYLTTVTLDHQKDSTIFKQQLPSLLS